MEAQSKFLMDCHVAGRLYHDADLVFTELKVGTQLDLVREPDNRYDAEAIALCYRGVTVGYIPSARNTLLSVFLDMGWGNELFECRICKVDPQEHYENQLHVVVRVKRKAAPAPISGEEEAEKGPGDGPELAPDVMPQNGTGDFAGGPAHDLPPLPKA